MKAKRISCALATFLALLLTATSCFGPFNATRRVHTWNREFENRWAGEGVFLAFSILWVNRLMWVADALVFNSIEFWGGTNPIDPPSKERLQALRDADDARAREAGYEVEGSGTMPEK